MQFKSPKTKQSWRTMSKVIFILGFFILPVFWHCKPNNEKVRKNVFYRGAIAWNILPSVERNMNLNEFNVHKRKEMVNVQ